MCFKYTLVAMFLLCGSVFAQESSKATASIKVRLINGSPLDTFIAGEKSIKLNKLFASVLERHNSGNKITIEHLRKNINEVKKINPRMKVSDMTLNYIKLDPLMVDILYLRIDYPLSNLNSFSSNPDSETMTVSLIYN